MSKTVKIFGKQISLIALTLILMSTLAVTGIAAFAAYWSQMKPISVNIVGNVYMFDIYTNPECTIPLTGIDFGDVMQSNEVDNSVIMPTTGFYYLQLDVDPTPNDVTFYWIATTPSEWAPDPANPLVEFIVWHNGDTQEKWEEGTPIQWSMSMAPSLVMEIFFELRVNTDIFEGLYGFDITFESGEGI